MCCVSCIAIPIFIWIWFYLIMPVVNKVKSLIWPKEQQVEKVMDEKNIEQNYSEANTTATTAPEDKKNS